MDTLRLKPGECSSLILLSGVLWEDKRWRDDAIYADWGEGSLYAVFKGPVKSIADTIIAIHDKDVETLRRKRRWVMTAWAFVRDSYSRRDSSTSADWRKETWPKLKKLERFAKPYLTP